MTDPDWLDYGKREGPTDVPTCAHCRTLIDTAAKWVRYDAGVRLAWPGRVALVVARDVDLHPEPLPCREAWLDARRAERPLVAGH